MAIDAQRKAELKARFARGLQRARTLKARGGDADVSQLLSVLVTKHALEGRYEEACDLLEAALDSAEAAV